MKFSDVSNEDEKEWQEAIAKKRKSLETDPRFTEAMAKFVECIGKQSRRLEEYRNELKKMSFGEDAVRKYISKNLS